MTSSSSSHSSLSEVKKKYDSSSKALREKNRRRRNVESASRSRKRKAQEKIWDHLQILENEAKIKDLEIKAKMLTEELLAPPRSSSSLQHGRDSNSSTLLGSDRQPWYGEPF